MWDFLSTVLQEGGTVAALFFVVLFASGVAFRALWKQNQGLHIQLSQEKDKRLEDALKMYMKMTKHAETIDAAMGRLTSSLDVLIRLSGRGD